jgi:hypothetical protein
MTGHCAAGAARCRSGAVLTGIVLAVGWQAGLAAAAPVAAAPGERVVLAGGAAQTFTISGSLSQLLVPGLSEPLDLRVTDPSTGALRLTGLEVTVTGVAPLFGLACSSNDFAVTQYSGPSGLTVAGSTTSALSALGVPTTQLPQVRMLETHVNQDGCQGATVNLAYTGTAIGGTAHDGHGRDHRHDRDRDHDHDHDHGNYNGYGGSNGYGGGSGNVGNGNGAGNGGGARADNGGSSSTPGALSPTGAEGAWPITLAALAMVTVGGAAYLVARRRKEPQR